MHCLQIKAHANIFLKDFVFLNISYADLQTLYSSDHLNPDVGPQSLQNKVMWDVRYFFCRCGGENIEDMTKDTVKLEYDVESKMAYVKKVKDELDKNHHESDTEIVTGFMPQLLTASGKVHKMCPVRSFENYIAHLNPGSEWLWQQARKKISHVHHQIWYEKRPIGHNPIDSFMSRLSSMCQLTQRYTNHCIRVTGATNLSKIFTSKQVMSVTGHKSLHSLAIYQRVQSDEKLCMGMWLTYNLFHPQDATDLRARIFQETKEQEALQNTNKPPPALPSTSTSVADNFGTLQPENSQLVPVTVPAQPIIQQGNNSPLTTETPQHDEDAIDFDLAQILQEFNNDTAVENEMVLASTQIENRHFHANKTTNMISKTNSPKLFKPSFNNCSIGTINIHIHKN